MARGSYENGRDDAAAAFGASCAGVGDGVALEAATGLRPLLKENERLGAGAAWAACISSLVPAQ